MWQHASAEQDGDLVGVDRVGLGHAAVGHLHGQGVGEHGGRGASRPRSSTSGPASTESQPCQMNCMVILTPRKPRKWMWFHAVFQSSSDSMYSMETCVWGL